jgi:hypothetical protein
MRKKERLFKVSYNEIPLTLVTAISPNCKMFAIPKLELEPPVFYGFDGQVTFSFEPNLCGRDSI